MSASHTPFVREQFKKYGFIPSNSFKFRGVYYSYRVFDEVHNKFTRYMYKNFLDDIASGKVQPVDPFIHYLQSPATQGQSLRNSDKYYYYTAFP